MPTSFWWMLPPLPKQKRREPPPEPGFTEEELQYLQSTLSIIESLSIDGLGLTTEPIGAGENMARPSQVGDVGLDRDRGRDAKSRRRIGNEHTQKTRTRSQSWEQVSSLPEGVKHSLSNARLWTVTHPNTVAVFLVFIASSLLSRNPNSLQALVGISFLVAGLKIMAATEDGFELPPPPRYSSPPRRSTLVPYVTSPIPQRADDVDEDTS
ncbi:hypothetical protein FRC14_002722 [Serendipita sp. 396]|nr:hypothetical protein FRC14_002722 [Serendipita sp. 396]KAG8789732.1 hypothetical protein FRC15_003801 [Serendipita sp. 397]KAG8804271.1 hypothetical protein FRC16_010600 [Serendipita sp. 398]KAG8838358.1 hypothetical protein FRC18_004963 [Serendipita sp. 400]KAG8877496.1 hypothetical protein FRC20_011165 [Serendipita sp. 405]KAG9054722.1 hypothetical protein FS842_004315 [Serendipita sp. 407]